MRNIGKKQRELIKKKIDGISLSQKNLETQFYAECFCYFTKSFLDVFIKFLVGKKYIFQYNKKKKKNQKYDIYFNYNFLNRISPETNYIICLKNYWKNGLTKKKYSLEVFNKYRNIITHANTLSWAEGNLIKNTEKYYEY